MIKLAQKISIPSIDSVDLYDVEMRMGDFAIVDMVRYLDPQTPATIALQAQITEAEEELAAAAVTSSTANFNIRMALTRTRDDLKLQLQPLLIADSGVALATLRYFAVKDSVEMPLPIIGLKEKFECFISDLEAHPGEDENMFVRAKTKMRAFIVDSLIESKFMGFDQTSDFIIVQ